MRRRINYLTRGIRTAAEYLSREIRIRVRLKYLEDKTETACRPSIVTSIHAFSNMAFILYRVYYVRIVSQWMLKRKCKLPSLRAKFSSKNTILLSFSAILLFRQRNRDTETIVRKCAKQFNHCVYFHYNFL